MSANVLHLTIILLASFTFMWQVTSQGSAEKTDPPPLLPCGQYNFRCVDEKMFEICPYNDDGSEKREQYVCSDGLVCDEENSAYCSPIDPSMTTRKPKGRQTRQDVNPVEGEEEQDGYDDYMGGLDAFRGYDEDMLRFEREAPSADSNQECPCAATTTTPSPTSTTEDSSFTTDGVTIEPAFDCDGYGFYPDDNNNTLFWYCDVPRSGNGYLIRHMVCGTNRVYDKLARTCVLRGTTRNIRRLASKDVAERSGHFACSHREPGKYPDPDDCQVYHVCLPNQYAPVKELLFACPEKTAYDGQQQKCTAEAWKKSQPATATMAPKSDCSRPKPPNCGKPIRFRSIDDCEGYYLCYSDNVVHLECPEYYKFDDQFHECMPEKIAKCRED